MLPLIVGAYSADVILTADDRGREIPTMDSRAMRGPGPRVAPLRTD